jgi:hypothetical protein
MRAMMYFVVCTGLFVEPAIGQMLPEGIWADEDQQHVYAFLDNDRLSYWSRVKYHSDPANSYIRRDGTWQSKEPMCWLGKRTGNVMLYANDQKCCMTVQTQGDKIILSNVWGEPEAGFGICEDRVLSRVDSAPGDLGQVPTTADQAK